MNEILKYYSKSLSNKTLSLKKKGLLVEKPWSLIDVDGEMQKLIFKRDKGLILAKNGVVSEGYWDYYPEARALLIDRVKDKLLLKEQYIDDNVLILKKDGTTNDYLALANENTIPDLNIPNYLNSLKKIVFNIKEEKLIDGNILQIYNADKVNNKINYNGHTIEILDENFNLVNTIDGLYLTKDKKYSFFIENGLILNVECNIIKQLSGNRFVEIIGGSNLYDLSNKHKRVTINGRNIPDQRLIDENNVIFDIKKSIVSAVYYLMDYETKSGYSIKIEQKKDSISKGDIIVDSKPISPLPDGIYKIIGKWKKINVVDNVIQ